MRWRHGASAGEAPDESFLVLFYKKEAIM